jgi:hypothetical protein
MRTNVPYDEHYGTCSYTHVWLRIMHEALDPDEVTQLLGVSPTEIQRAGEPRSPKTDKVHKCSGWFLSTEGILMSLDARHHFDWILERVGDKQSEFSALLERGYLLDVCCRWDSKSGQGGPTLSPPHMLGFARLGVDLWFDLYFDGPD